MACDVLFGESSPLYTRLYQEGVINSSLGGNFDMLPGASYLYVGGETKEPRRVFEEFYQQVRRASYGGMIRSLNSFENIAISLVDGRFRGYDAYRFPEVFETVTKADVEAFLREEVTAGHAAISLVEPLG